MLASVAEAGRIVGAGRKVAGLSARTLTAVAAASASSRRGAHVSEWGAGGETRPTIENPDVRLASDVVAARTVTDDEHHRAAFEKGLVYKERLSSTAENQERPKKGKVSETRARALLDDVPAAPRKTTKSNLPLGSAAEVTVLPNGLHVATIPMPASATTTFGLLVNAGSRNQDDTNDGVCHLLERMAFKDTPSRTTADIVSLLEFNGGNTMAAASRDIMIYTGDSLKANVPAVAEMLVDSILHPEFDEDEIETQKAFLLQDIEATLADPGLVLNNNIFEAAYNLETAGRPLVAPPESMPGLNRDVVKRFVDRHYTTDRMAFVAAGYDHAEFVKIAEDLFADAPMAPPPGLPKPDDLPAVYTGGETVLARPDIRHCGLGIYVEGRSWADVDVVAAAALQSLMGGGGSFSSGGPGKGMYTRLYQEVLRNYHFDHISAVNACFTDSGIFGISVFWDPEVFRRPMPEVQSVLLTQLASMANRINEAELSRTKAMLKSGIMMNLEQRHVAYEDLGRQMLIYGRVLDAGEVLGQIDALTVQQLQEVARSMLTTEVTQAVFAPDYLADGRVSRDDTQEQLRSMLK